MRWTAEAPAAAIALRLRALTLPWLRHRDPPPSFSYQRWELWAPTIPHFNWAELMSRLYSTTCKSLKHGSRSGWGKKYREKWWRRRGKIKSGYLQNCHKAVREREACDCLFRKMAYEIIDYHFKIKQTQPNIQNKIGLFTKLPQSCASERRAIVLLGKWFTK